MTKIHPGEGRNLTHNAVPLPQTQAVERSCHGICKQFCVQVLVLPRPLSGHAQVYLPIPGSVPAPDRWGE